MRKIIVFLLLLGFSATVASAQEVYNSSGKPGYQKKTKKHKGYDPDRLIVGGGLNAGFGGGYVNVGIAPIVGYRLNKIWSAGIGLGYQYNRTPEYADPSNQYAIDYAQANIVYPSVWTRCFLYRNIFADAVFEYDMAYVKEPDYNYNSNEMEFRNTNYNIACGLVGIGLKQPLGGRVSFYGEIMYDVLQQDHSPYLGQPIFRFGIAAGF